MDEGTFRTKGVTALDDQTIKTLLNARDEKALSACETLYGRLCRRLAYAILGSDADAEEVVNDAYLRVWNAVPPADPPTVKGFLALVVRTKAIDRVREETRKKRGGEQWTSALEELAEILPDEKEDGGAFPDRIALKEALGGFLSSLPETDRRIFMLRYWWMEPVSAVAADAGLSLSAAKMRLMRLRAKCADYLRREGFVI